MMCSKIGQTSIFLDRNTSIISPRALSVNEKVHCLFVC